MKNQALFSSKDKIKNLKCRLLQFLFGASRVALHQLLTVSLDELGSLAWGLLLKERISS